MVGARILTIAILAGAGASAQADDVMRCGSKIIEIGMLQSEVMQHCGEPTSRDVSPQAVRSGNRMVGTTPMERWTYSDYSSTRVLTFDGDKLVSIEDQP